MSGGNDEWRVRATDIAGRWQAVREAIPWAGRVLLALAVTVPIRFAIGLVELVAGRETEVVIELSLAGGISTGVSLLLAGVVVALLQTRKQNGILRGQNEELRTRLEKFEGPQEDPE